MATCNDPQSSPNELNRLIALDPSLAGQVLRLINSAYYSLNQPVSSLSRAIIMLGVNTVKNLVLKRKPAMIIKFWGVRGSIPTPGFDTAKYGGNTVCVELNLPDIQRHIIIDAGSGLRLLGDQLLAAGSVSGGLETDIFLTHTHLDHIIGFPFFAPIYMPETCLNIYGPVTCEDDSLETVIGWQIFLRVQICSSMMPSIPKRNMMHLRGGGGHSSIEYAIDAARRSEVRRLALFHHDPMRTDAQLDQLTDIHCNNTQAGDTLFFCPGGHAGGNLKTG